MRELAAGLRGSLHYKAIDARRVTMAAKNASCVRLRAMVMAGVDPNAVAEQVFGLPTGSEQSGFALRQGNAFERAQARNGGARLLEALRQGGILGDGDMRVLDLAQLPDLTSPSPIRRLRARRRAIAETDNALRGKCARAKDAPNVILQAHLPLPLGENGEEALVRPDALIARTGELMYRVGEIKSFAALKHLTDEQDVGNAAAQSGVYVVALEAALRRLNLPGEVPGMAALVFRKPGGFTAEPTLQPIGRDIATARRMLEQRPRSLREIEQLLGPGQSLDSEGNVLRLPANFVGACRSFCPMWQVCLNESRRRKMGRRTTVKYRIRTVQERLPVRRGDKLCPLDDSTYRYCVQDVATGEAGDTTVTLELINGKTKGGQPEVGDRIELGEPLSSQERIARTMGLAHERLRTKPTTQPVQGRLRRRQNYLAGIRALRRDT